MQGFNAGCLGQAFLLLLLTIGSIHRQVNAFEEWSDIGNTKAWKEEVKRIQPPFTHGDDCTCKSGEQSCMVDCSCVPTVKVCDGIVHCEGGHDESQCSPKHLCKGKFACKNGKCIRHEFTCDNVNDCGDNSDETMCRGNLPRGQYNCTSPQQQFNCTKGDYCIPIGWRCDGDADCVDRSDEADCFLNSTCEPSEFKCRTGRCIGNSFMCNGRNDCDDNSDELNCDSETIPQCQANEFQCKTLGRCVAEHYKCDGEDDCGDWSDEADCKNRTSCSSDSYRCESGRCIEKAWVCDGGADCENGEDEKGCKNKPMDCPREQMYCPNKCISIKWKCDGETDCPGGEDETNCEGQLTCEKDLFTCSSGECIRKHKICDGRRDCLNGKDEENCTYSSCNSKTCSYKCHQPSEGEENCLCQEGYTLDKDNKTCIDIDECTTFRPCSQLCENTIGGFKCKCVNGYSIKADKMTCKAQSPPARLIFATRDDVREISLSGEKYPPIALSLENAIAVDFHYRRGLIYWTDVTIDAILVAYTNGTGKREIIRCGLQQPSGLAVDWYNDHIYWVDTTTRRVEVADLDGSNRRPLIWTNLQKPRSIIVHPAKSIIIWTDWGENARIEQAYLDGTGRKILIGERLFWPNGITIDYPTETLYWVDAKQHAIESAYIDGTQRRTVNEHKIPHPFAITIFEDRLYWTDWKTESIRSINKRTGRDSTIVHSNVVFPMGIKSMHPQRQPLRGMGDRVGCSWKNGGCSHLCLSSSGGRSTCFCPHGLLMQADGRQCSARPNHLLLFAQANNIRMISLEKELKSCNETCLEDNQFKRGNESDSDTPGHKIPRMDNVVPVDSVQTAMAIDFDDKTDMVYWSDLDAKSISRAHINGSGQQIIVQSNLDEPSGIAVDWINDKLYWTDDGKDRIEVSNLDGSTRALLIWDKIHHPRDIVVHPEEGILFWSEWGDNATIQRADMDGGNRVVMANTRLKWPNGLAVDREMGKLFWLDAHYKVVEFSDFDGRGRKVMFSRSLAHPFGLAIFGKYIFWSDWKTMGIYMAEKSRGHERQKLVQGLKGLMDVRVFHHRKNNASFQNPCASRNGGCSHMCLLKPRGHSCTCPTGLLLQDGRKKCKSSPGKWLVIAHRDVVRTLALDTPYLADVVLKLFALHNVVALDVDPLSGEIYLPDGGVDAAIFRCSNDGLFCESVITSTVTTIEGIAIEPTTRKMYWTDLTRKSIEVSELNGTSRLVLFTKLDQPRAIITHYPSGKLYWTDWADNHPRIEVANLDGTDRKVFVKENIAWPNGLTIDWSTNDLYWTDAKFNHIEAINFNGENRRIIVSGQHVTHPYGLAILDEWVYWTDWEAKSLLRAKKNTNNGRQQKEVLVKGLTGLMDVKALPDNPPKENICGSNNGGCSRLCLRNPSGHSCKCPTGLMLKADKKNCTSIPSKYLLVASRGLIRRISLDTEPAWDVGIEIPGTIHPVSIDVHYEKKLLFYSDNDAENIGVGSLQNKYVPETIPTHGFTTPDNLAVDWIANNLYWTDVEQKKIEVERIETYSQKVIINEDLNEARALAVFPEKGFLFWTDWSNETKIERASLDGSDRIVIISSDLGWPNGLVIDTIEQKLYWTDGHTNRIEMADLDGKNRIQLVEKLSHPFGITLMDNHVYWTDWEKKSIERADKKTGKNHIQLVVGIEEPMQIVSVGPSIQRGWNPCADRICPFLCLYRSRGDVVCACPDAPTPSCSNHTLTNLPGPNPSNSKKNPLDNGGKTHNNPNIVTTVVVIGVVAVIIIAVMIGGLMWARCRKAQKAVEAAKADGTALTYTNPTYAASHSDVNTDRKPFNWRRTLHDTPQGRLFEEKGEVAALISEGSSVEHESPPPSPPARPRPS